MVLVRHDNETDREIPSKEHANKNVVEQSTICKERADREIRLNGEEHDHELTQTQTGTQKRSEGHSEHEQYDEEADR